jgi:hypothetical protein
MPVGIFYRNEELPAYHDQLIQLDQDTLLAQRPTNISLAKTLAEFR